MSTTSSPRQPSGPGVTTRHGRGSRLLATWIACLAVLAVSACQGGDGSDDGGADADPASSTTTDDPTPRAEQVFADLADDYPALGEPSLTPEQEYGSFLAEHDANLSGCARRAETGGSCPKPRSLQGGDLEKTVNVQLLLDASGSMAGTVSGKSKIAIARKVMLRFVDSMPDQANVSLRVFGHVGSNSAADKQRSCRTTELVQPWTSAGSGQLRSAVKSFEPRGWTPLAKSMKASLGDFQRRGGENASNFVYMISDGIETCGGNPVAAARRLGHAGIGVDVNIVGFDVDSAAQRQLRRAARVADGTYTDASDAAELSKAFDDYDWAAWSDYYLCKYNQANDDLIAIRNAANDNLICLRNSMNDELIAIRNAANDLLISRRNAADDALLAIRNLLHDTDGLSSELKEQVLRLAEERHTEVVRDAESRNVSVLRQAERRHQLILRGFSANHDKLLVQAENEHDRILAELERQDEARR